jgi:hypothetical protein
VIRAERTVEWRSALTLEIRARGTGRDPGWRENAVQRCANGIARDHRESRNRARNGTEFYEGSLSVEGTSGCHEPFSFTRSGHGNLGGFLTLVTVEALFSRTRRAREITTETEGHAKARSSNSSGTEEEATGVSEARSVSPAPWEQHAHVCSSLMTPREAWAAIRRGRARWQCVAGNDPPKRSRVP